MKEKPHDKLIIHRKHRPSPLHGDEGEGLWAVSYADLLMVLMSFFIVFFNIESKSSSKLNNIIVAFQDDLKILEKDQKTGKLYRKSKNNRDKLKFLSVFKESDKQKKQEVTSDMICADTEKFVPKNCMIGDMTTLSFIDSKNRSPASNQQVINESPSEQGIIIDFPDNIYELGAYRINKDLEERLNEVLSKIEPYKSNFNLVFIGHSDKTPMKKSRKIIETNLILSSLRASLAVDFAVKKGFDSLWVSAQGVGEFQRDTRSLSLRIVER